MNSSVEVRRMQVEDIQGMLSALDRDGFHKPPSLFDRYYREQNSGDRDVLVAFTGEGFAGYLTIMWESDYPGFRDAGIPEINDFNVLPGLRRQGIGTRLMDEAERIVAERTEVVGIGFGMGADYGPAQRLYVLRGYVPDGRGLMDHSEPVQYGKQITVSHELAIYLVKRLR